MEIKKLSQLKHLLWFLEHDEFQFLTFVVLSLIFSKK